MQNSAQSTKLVLNVEPATTNEGQPYEIYTGYYRHQVGDVEVTALLDGYTDLGLETFVGDDPIALRQLLGAAFVADDHIQFGVVVHLLKTPNATILIDAGSSTYFGPAAGHLPASMALAGVDSAEIDAVVLTHMHTDHTGGLVLDGRAAFPNAELVVNRIEYEFFSNPDELATAPARIQPAFRLAQTLADYYPRMRQIAGDEVVNEVLQAIPAYGHTPGHTVYLLTSKGEHLLLLGDAVFSPDFSFQYLDYTLAFDGDIALARKKRRQLLTLAMDNRWLTAGTHMPFPSLGHVRASGPAFEFVPLRVAP